MDIAFFGALGFKKAGVQVGLGIGPLLGVLGLYGIPLFFHGLLAMDMHQSQIGDFLGKQGFSRPLILVPLIDSSCINSCCSLSCSDRDNSRVGCTSIEVAPETFRLDSVLEMDRKIAQLIPVESSLGMDEGRGSDRDVAVVEISVD